MVKFSDLNSFVSAGFRWESSEIGVKDNDVKQVDDLLNDLTALTTFAIANAHHSANYELLY